ncbi:MAG: glycosyltransferase family 2 protein, partial [Pseudomonadota bacterium]
MKLTLLIGPTERAAARFRVLFKTHETALRKAGVIAPDWNHVRLYAACSAPDAVGLLRYRRGLASPLAPATLQAEFQASLGKEVPKLRAKHVVLAAAQLGNLLTAKEDVQRLKTLLSPHFDDIRIVLHLDEQARLLTEHYGFALGEGRRKSLHAELDLATTGNWWQRALALRQTPAPHHNLFNDVQHPAPWLDYTALVDLWQGIFGNDAVRCRPLCYQTLCGTRGLTVLAQALDLKKLTGETAPEPIARPPSAAFLTRMRHMNDVLIRYAQAREIVIPNDLWRQIHRSLRLSGAPLIPGSLSAVSDHFRAANTDLSARFPALADALIPDDPATPWEEADPEMGFRATQYLAAYSYAIRKNAQPLAEKLAEDSAARKAADKFDALVDKTQKSADAQSRNRLLHRIKVNHQMVLSTRFRPHNNLGAVNEEELAAAFTPAPPRPPQTDGSGRLIVSCMKNEAPYIIEWIAYHRAIGIDSFVVHTNDCTDGTDKVLNRLEEMGIVHHRDNTGWRGNSPQQYALNQSMKDPVVTSADWIAHIDVDEFMNIRTGNGTLDDLFAAVPDATNIAMTWRLFGHNGVKEMSDRFVIDQFDTCAPKYCPKPHTVWGFKTMFRNIGAYGKLSCHRPNKLAEGFETQVKWVNGSGRDMTQDAAHKGWRSSKTTVGYDLLQLNHYALRSAESFLIKR